MTVFINAALPLGLILIVLGFGITVGLLLEWFSERAHARAVRNPLDPQKFHFSPENAARLRAAFFSNQAAAAASRRTQAPPGPTAGEAVGLGGTTSAHPEETEQ